MVDPADIYDINLFFARTFERGLFADVNFVVQGECISAHRCVLLVRSEYFMEMFSTKWRDRKTIQLTNKLV